MLFASDHTCCKCRLSWKTSQIHHLDEDPSNNDASNLAVLCLECHNETQVRGGFGRHLSAQEVAQYRDDWIVRVTKRRDDADAMAALAMARVGPSAASGPRSPNADWVPPIGDQAFPNWDGMCELIEGLPELRRQAYVLMHARKPRSTLETVDAYRTLVDVLRATMVRLLSYYPQNHFAEAGPAFYVSSVVAERTHWHYLRNSTHGVGESGTLVQMNTSIGVVRDLERMIAETVSALIGTEVREPDELEKAWQESWYESVQ